MTVMARVYLDGPAQLQTEMSERAIELCAQGFTVLSCVPTQPLFARIAEMSLADVGVFFVTGAVPAHLYALAGYALSAGMRIIAVGSVKHIPEDVRGLFILQVDSWEDLSANQYLKLGEVRFKKLAPTPKPSIRSKK